MFFSITISFSYFLLELHPLAAAFLILPRRAAFTEPSNKPFNQPNVPFLTQFFVFTIWFT